MEPKFAHVVRSITYVVHEVRVGCLQQRRAAAVEPSTVRRREQFERHARLVE